MREPNQTPDVITTSLKLKKNKKKLLSEVGMATTINMFSIRRCYKSELENSNRNFLIFIFLGVAIIIIITFQLAKFTCNFVEIQMMTSVYGKS